MRLKARVEQLEKDLERCNHKLQTLSDFTNRSLLEFKKQQDEFEAKVHKQEELINALVKICEPIILERITNAFGEIANGLEKELKDLFGSEPAKKCKKGAKSSAEKCKKCGGRAKTAKKTGDK